MISILQRSNIYVYGEKISFNDIYEGVIFCLQASDEKKRIYHYKALKKQENDIWSILNVGNSSLSRIYRSNWSKVIYLGYEAITEKELEVIK